MILWNKSQQRLHVPEICNLQWESFALCFACLFYLNSGSICGLGYSWSFHPMIVLHPRKIKWDMIWFLFPHTVIATDEKHSVKKTDCGKNPSPSNAKDDNSENQSQMLTGLLSSGLDFESVDFDWIGGVPEKAMFWMFTVEEPCIIIIFSIWSFVWSVYLQFLTMHVSICFAIYIAVAELVLKHTRSSGSA